jgi:DNA invertase Pin-like site-specific DNA recombinase
MRIKALKTSGVTLLSYQESWLETLGEMADLFIALLSWVAQFESQRRSERTKAGLARAKLEGKGRRGKDSYQRKRKVLYRPEKSTSKGHTQK